MWIYRGCWKPFESGEVGPAGSCRNERSQTLGKSVLFTKIYFMYQNFDTSRQFGARNRRASHWSRVQCEFRFCALSYQPNYPMHEPRLTSMPLFLPTFSPAVSTYAACLTQRSEWWSYGRIEPIFFCCLARCV